MHKKKIDKANDNFRIFYFELKSRSTIFNLSTNAFLTLFTFIDEHEMLNLDKTVTWLFLLLF